jgi:hypothetical protein
MISSKVTFLAGDDESVFAEPEKKVNGWPLFLGLA